MEQKRRYELKKRALSREETRRRIVEATMHLHEELGPRATTISAIAEKAGVQRLTVYRHFPDETAVFQACTSHWLSLNPPPDPATWSGLADPWERLKTGFQAFFDYYSRTRRMWTAAHRDAADVPALHGPMAAFAAFVRTVGTGLSEGLCGGVRVAMTVQHALAFSTWAELDARALSDADKTDLAIAWVKGALSAAG